MTNDDEVENWSLSSFLLAVTSDSNFADESEDFSENFEKKNCFCAESI